MLGENSKHDLTEMAMSPKLTNNDDCSSPLVMGLTSPFYLYSDLEAVME